MGGFGVGGVGVGSVDGWVVFVGWVVQLVTQQHGGEEFLGRAAGWAGSVVDGGGGGEVVESFGEQGCCCGDPDAGWGRLAAFLL